MYRVGDRFKREGCTDDVGNIYEIQIRDHGYALKHIGTEYYWASAVAVGNTKDITYKEFCAMADGEKNVNDFKIIKPKDASPYEVEIVEV